MPKNFWTWWETSSGPAEKLAPVFRNRVRYRKEGSPLFSGTLTNGLGVYIYPTDRFKSIAIHAVWVVELGAKSASRSALVPYVLRRGTNRWPTWTAMEAHLDSLYGASFRADVGKVGDKQLLSFHLDIPDGRFLPGHPDNLAAGVEFLAAVMQDPHLVDGLFAMDVVNQEKEILRRQIQGLINDKARYATIRLMEQLADGRPFGIRRFGTVEDVDRVANEDLLAWYRHITRHAPLLYFVVGAVDPSSTDHMIREVWPRTVSEDIHPVPLFEPRHHRQLTVDEQEVQQGQLNLGFATRRRLPDPDFPALMMYAGILGGFPHSKLFVNVREKASLAYYAYARVDGAVGLMLIGSGIDVHNFSPAFQIIEEQVEAMTSGAISDQEMAFTLRSFINDLRTEEDAPQSLIGRQMDRILMGGGWSTEDLAPALERVTLQDIIRVASDVELDSVYFLTAKGEGAHARLH